MTIQPPQIRSPGNVDWFPWSLSYRRVSPDGESTISIRFAVDLGFVPLRVARRRSAFSRHRPESTYNTNLPPGAETKSHEPFGDRYATRLSIERCRGRRSVQLGFFFSKRIFNGDIDRNDPFACVRGHRRMILPCLVLPLVLLSPTNLSACISCRK